MLRPTQLSPSKIYPLLDWFIPEEMKSEAEKLRRARMFLISHLFGPFLGHTISLSILYIDPAPDLAWWVFFGVIMLFWAFPIALKLTGWFVPLALLSVQNLIFTILWGCYHYGGTSSPLIPWVITVPLLAFFYLGSGRGVRIFVLAIILLNLAGFYGIYSLGNGFPEHIPLAKLSGLGMISTVCASVYVSMMALYYANIAMSQSELELEIKRRLETANQLREATDEAERANRAKSDFLAKMSHELRTPLNAVIGYSEIMLDEAECQQRPRQSADLRKIHKAGKQLLKLISDLLDLSKLDAGKMDLFVETIEVRPLIASVVAEYREAIAVSGNEVAVECADGIDTIDGDLTKLHRVLSDLMSNALKFTKHGKVTIAATTDDEWLSIAISDTGCGIAQQKLRTLFNDFEAPEDSSTSKYGDTGLGLPLSQRLCRLMHGDIRVESVVGRGSVVTVRVPRDLKGGNELGDRGYASVDPAAPGRADGNVVLVIDDDTAVLDLMQRILTKEGYSAVVAASAFEGLELAKRLVPSMIVLDVLMPELDGWQLLKLLRRDRTLAGTGIILLTVDDNITKGRSLGADGHIMKPVDRRALLGVLAEIKARAAAPLRLHA